VLVYEGKFFNISRKFEDVLQIDNFLSRLFLPYLVITANATNFEASRSLVRRK